MNNEIQVGNDSYFCGDTNGFSSLDSINALPDQGCILNFAFQNHDEFPEKIISIDNGHNGVSHRQGCKWNNSKTHKYIATTLQVLGVQNVDTGVIHKTKQIRDLIFAFLASTAGLSSLLWIVIRGGSLLV